MHEQSNNTEYEEFIIDAKNIRKSERGQECLNSIEQIKSHDVNIRKEWTSLPISVPGYLEEFINAEFAREKALLNHMFNWEPEKMRSFYLVMTYEGLKSIQEMNECEFVEKSNELLDSPPTE